MSWSNFQEEAFNLTRAEVAGLSRQVLREYDKAIKNIEKQITEVYANILAGVNPEDFYDEMLKRNRLETLLAQVKRDYNAVSRAAGTLTRNAISLAFSNTYYRKLYAARWLVPEMKFGLLPKELISLSVLGTKKAWDEITLSIIKKYGEKINYVPQKGTLSSLLASNNRKEINNLIGAITQSFINGNSKSKTVYIIKDIIGRATQKDGKTKITGSKANAMRILRTETNRTMNMGSYAQSKYADSLGIEIRRRLMATLDTRTRRQSAVMDGQTVGVDEPFRYPDGTKALTPGTTGIAAYDVNDRETVIDLVDDFEPTIRRGRNPVTGKNEVFSYKDFDQWAKDNNLSRQRNGIVRPATKVKPKTSLGKAQEKTRALKKELASLQKKRADIKKERLSVREEIRKKESDIEKELRRKKNELKRKQAEVKKRKEKIAREDF